MNVKLEDKLSRRNFLKKTGAFLIVMIWGGSIWRAVDQGVFQAGRGSAFEPWEKQDNGAFPDQLKLIQAAVLASNPHNTQPWLFKVTDDYIDIYADESRHLGAFDPFKREMFIGLGCAIENMMQAAAENGFSARLQYTPLSMEPLCIARVHLEQAYVTPAPLFSYIFHRHTNRGVYDGDRPIPAQLYQEMEHLTLEEKNVDLRWFSSTEDKKKISDLIVQSTEAIIADEEMSIASNRWFKDSWQDVQQSRDGITLDAQGESFFIRAIGKMLPPLSRERNDQFWLNATRDRHTATAAAYGLLSVRNAAVPQQPVRAGRVWQRIHLFGTKEGLGMHPLNQLNEMSDREQALKKTSFFHAERSKLTPPGWDGIFLFRLGYPLKTPLPSPRRAVEDVMM
ncbi:hypothetical protein M3212_12325 [Alkalihalobacillus oceani]|uniref:Acg family FMN-binding oxidoreductase n=1 Tax=Halalkalibacter oceani TaxID=1653776 RepID=UPI00203F24E2|nr:hypothetical protein [Halalkalibacter oceani]MCM3761572.1 hypothetical protein [Halalkalibacter oceani]